MSNKAKLFIDIFSSATKALSESELLSDALSTIIKNTCISLDFPFGAYWESSNDAETISCKYTWFKDDKLKEVDKATVNRVFKKGEGLAGLILKEGKPFLLTDIKGDKRVLRLSVLSAAGIKGAVGFPLLYKNEVLGICEFFSYEPLIIDEDLNEVMSSIAIQMGLFMKRHQMETELKQKHWEIEDFIENAAVPLHWVGADGKIIWANQAEFDLLGYKPEEYIGKSIMDFHADEAVIEDILKRLKQNETLQNYRARLRSKDGSIKHVLINSNVLIKDGNFVHTRCFTRDVTREVEVLQRLQEGKQLTKAVIDAALDAVVVTDQDGIITEWNKQAENIFGWSNLEAIGQPMSTMIIPEEYREAHRKGMERFLATREAKILNRRIEITAINRDLKVFPIELTVAFVEKDNKVFFTAFIRDITEKKLIDSQLTQALKSAEEARDKAETANMAKNEFLANMSHEIRTPMNAIIGLSNILNMSSPLTQKQKEFIKTLQMSADSLLALINDLLDISKIEANTVQLEEIPFNLTQLTNEVISMVTVRAREKGLNFTMEGECVRDKHFIGDPTRIRQMILNLCSNAVKFTEKGNIDISITCSDNETPGIEDICIAVTDTGIGIPQEKIETIFNKFIQADSSINRRYGGTGLGLAITKTLTEIMKGTITVESEEGVGSTFKICLPLVVAESDSTAPNTQTKETENIVDQANPSKQRILIVEDYPPNVLVASNYLDNLGFRYDVAVNGVDAIEKVKNNYYFAILMDVQMPGMNGFETTQHIRTYEKQKGKKPIHIIGMTAHALAGDRDRCISAGMDDYISKPFNFDELKDRLYLLA